jgi:ppGpp synthetase/RelA/SpoT-type nucleotidyltranferase
MPNDSEEIDNLPLTIALKNQIEKETFIEIRNSLEQEAIDHMDNKTFEAYLELLENSQDNLDKKFENSLSKLSLNSNKYKAYLKIVRHMDKSIEDKNYNLPVEEELTPKFSEKFEKLKKDKLDNRLKDIRELNLNDFEENYNMAKKIRRYSLCSKDYMKNPKSSGYQSFHINVKTPWGYYEKQIRTANQDNHAEHGSASHDEAYKPYEKDKSFHRLKLPIPLVPARDENREIIFPVTLEIACFEDAVKLYYHQNFEYFSEGKSYKELVSTFSRDKFDEYLHNISNPQNNQNKMFTRVLKKFMEFMDLFNHGSNQR